MTTTEKTTHPRGGTAGPSRTILGWLDDDDLTVLADRGTMSSTQGLAPNEAVDMLVASHSLLGVSTGRTTEIVSQTRDYVFPDDSVVAGNCARVLTQQNFMMTDGGPLTRRGPSPVAIRPCDFHSSALPELADIELTIGFVKHTVRNALRELVSAYVRDHGTDYYGVIDDSDSTGLAYTDRLGDYPPLTRVYEDVEVVIGTEDEIEPRRYTDEDHQAWRL